ncbi:hypothetical protein M406DRAFT_347667 [Cryphonectria parasitica EP155]|uniref:DNA mismatch repair protein MSH3 n=1 Tax=Cryphonectria parasitica (strain ATCC 38755 / EP155) TaxID=660469 RepID=A0A9P5CM70_CRYP1|nr:uncharacterized protein M406DRAFT_347667 [Cryphonectria parasitica EP155]KAF3762786.1 hypothetical protein M406DRAFT_347667 [Cryphonectria parasitica EP155]
MPPATPGPSRIGTPAYSTVTNTASGRRSRAASTIGASEGHLIICAVSEARGVSPSVGLAFVNASTGEAVLSQICDNQCYVKTIHKMTIFEPTRILIVDTACPPNPKSSLYSLIEEELPEVRTSPLRRKYWSENRGMDLIQTLAFKDDVEAIKVAIEGNFYPICSFSAAIQCLDNEFSIHFANNSLRIKYQPSEEAMMISLPTIRALELIQNIQNPSSKASLFGLLNQTLTPMGARMLRSNILQPSTQAQVLTARLDALDELCTKEDMFFQVRGALKDFGDVEKMLTKIIVLPAEPSLAASEQAINDVLMIKNFVMAVPPLVESLRDARCALLVNIRGLCRPEITNPILERILGVINSDVSYSTKPLDLRNQRCYAVRADINGMLDVARATLKEITADLYEHVERLNTQLNLAADVRFEAKRNFWLRFRLSDFESGVIPGELIHCISKKEFLECQTLRMVQLNQRMTDAVNEITMQSDKVVEQLLDSIRADIPALFRICESVALLDMLSSFGQTVTTRDYVRPELKDALALKAGRHPILDSFIPNEYYATRQHAFSIVTGCNMSGKSTYIRSVALLQVMAQIGCFVPAQYACFTIIHSLLSRTSTDDSIESNMSTFSVEMREMAFIIRNINDRSLAIIDELGRGTSTRDGLAIAIAMAEALIQSNALVFFATHFAELAQLLGDRPGVLNLHLATETTIADDDIPKMTMLYKVGAGPVKEENYGINLARAIGFPQTFLDLAEKTSNSLRETAEAKKQCSESRKLVRRRKLVLNVHETLQQAYHSGMDGGALRSYLRRLQTEFITRMEEIENDGMQDGPG